MTNIWTLGAFAIIFDDDQRVLLCHRRDVDLWNLPGGGVEHGETPWDAVVREVHEETGLQVRVQRLQGVYAKPETDDLVFSFVCEIIGGGITLNDEANEIAWFSLNNIPENFPAKQRQRIRDAVAKLDDVVLKAQTGPSSLEVARHRTARD